MVRVRLGHITEYFSRYGCESCLTHWGRVTHICVSKLTIIGSDNGLSPDRRQAIIWTNAGILLIGPLGTNFSEISIEILTFSIKKMRLKVSSAKRRPFCLDLNVLIYTRVTSLLCTHNPKFDKYMMFSRKLLWWDQDTNFAHATTAELSWHVQNCDLIGSLE